MRYSSSLGIIMLQYFANQGEQINVKVNINLRSDYTYLKFYFLWVLRPSFPQQLFLSQLFKFGFRVELIAMLSSDYSYSYLSLVSFFNLKRSMTCRMFFTISTEQWHAVSPWFSLSGKTPRPAKNQQTRTVNNLQNLKF